MHPLYTLASKHKWMSFSTQLKAIKDNLGQDLQHLSNIVNKLDELGEILEDMLQIQDSVEVKKPSNVSKY